MKRVFFESYLESSRAEFLKSKNPTVAPDMLNQTIFERDDSPTQHIEKREKLMTVRQGEDGKVVKRSILGSIEEYAKTIEQK